MDPEALPVNTSIKNGVSDKINFALLGGGEKVPSYWYLFKVHAVYFRVFNLKIIHSVI